MIDTIIVAAVVLIAAIFIGRRFFKQFTSTESTCNCSGCGNSGSCGTIKDNPDQNGCCGNN